ncbi:CPBP family intramembrane metalloprotease (plasmid) [Bacillus mycoides]|uniref:CPBP family intramembrane glutamic endopeptidase n=1 Tax=Bacillus mycoides TaxID=1405 RepID=UPI001C02C522|nr:CPBP family intramembrane glutamic endopeptidase [Bacillus mycoides]QWH76008.1 CPBP family intramembrane metalloprotease [Bacillus mycoides]QWI47467.1 CPBP family intramembrane metalloprotease [Bacillus mycoides]
MTFIRDVVRPIIFLVTFVLLFILLVLADKISGLGISNNNNAIESLYLFSIVLAGIFIFPTIRKDFQNRFNLNKNKLYVTIGLPILIGILMQFIVNFIRFIPTFLGHDMIGIGSGQITYTTDLTKTGFLFLVSVIGPFNEEFVFRYLLYAGIFLALADFKTNFSWIEKFYNELFIHKNPKCIWGWILVTNVGFAVFHGPDISTFFLYFIPGAIYTLFFLRFGFLSAWLAHGAFNLCSSTVFSILTILFLQ